MPYWWHWIIPRNCQQALTTLWCNSCLGLPYKPRPVYFCFINLELYLLPSKVAFSTDPRRRFLSDGASCWKTKQNQHGIITQRSLRQPGSFKYNPKAQQNDRYWWWSNVTQSIGLTFFLLLWNLEKNIESKSKNFCRGLKILSALDPLDKLENFLRCLAFIYSKFRANLSTFSVKSISVSKACTS